MTEIKCKEIVLLNASLLQEFQDNANEHSPEHVKELAKWIDFYGFRESLIIDRQKNENGKHDIVCGNGRFQACNLLKMESIPCVMQDFKSYDEKYAFHVAHNASAKDEWSKLNLSKINTKLQEIGPDIPVEMLAIKDFVVEPIEKLEPQCDEDDCPEVMPDPITKRGDVWILGNHRVMCGDSTMIDDVEKLMNGQKADLWIADPPFGVSYEKKTQEVFGQKADGSRKIQNDEKSVEELKPFWRDVATNALLVTTDEASNYWCACQGSDKMMMMMMMMDEAGWNIRHELIWVKQQFVFGRCDYHYRHEPIIYGWKKKGKHNWYGDRKSDSVFEIDRPHKSEFHPTTKPVELFEKFILNSSKKGDLVFESFGGSGTSVIASEKSERKCYTMELDAKYCDTITKRWQDYTGKEAILESTGEKYNSLVKE
jgi:DNA modification methylase